jgi:hypothetical protein
METDGSRGVSAQVLLKASTIGRIGGMVTSDVSITKWFDDG